MNGLRCGSVPRAQPLLPVARSWGVSHGLLQGIGLLLLLWLPLMASAGLPPPKDLNQRVGFDQRLGRPVPMTLRFRDAAGRSVTLGELADGKPTLLALGYYRCPNLCDLVLQGMARAIPAVPLRPGEDYQVVFISIDPHETPTDAAAAVHMLAQMHSAASVARWHLLTGDQASIHGVAQAAGFRYFHDPRNGQYAHAAGWVVLTEQGTIAQYFFGVSYRPDALRLALVNASHGRLGNVLDRLVLLCCGYDPSTGRYSLLIGRVMQVLGVGFVLLMLLGSCWLRRRRQA
jgi:protein SCO1/2